MPVIQPRMQDLIHSSLAAVREARARSQLSKAWELLQERNAEGVAVGAQPYTDEAIQLFTSMHNQDPEDIGIVHHLAIAHHARAWDMELSGDPRAAGEWEHALGYWRIIASSPEFWEQMKVRLLACDPDADPAFFADARHDLLENLLSIHVDFVRHYCESNTPARATDHVEIVKRASIPPALKKRLTTQVFEAMTSALPEAKAARAFDSALTTLERFLALFPDHLPALRSYAEICKEWVSTLSYRENWDAIVRLSARAKPHADRLGAHPELHAESLARMELVELADEFALRGRDRSDGYLAQSESQNDDDLDVARAASEIGVQWARLGFQHGASDSLARRLLPACLNNHALVLHREGAAMLPAREAMTLMRQAVAELEEATNLEPDDSTLATNLAGMRDDLRRLEGWME